jgi:hypothetical protein
MLLGTAFCGADFIGVWHNPPFILLRKESGIFLQVCPYLADVLPRKATFKRYTA